MNKIIIDIETIPNQSLKDKPEFDETTVKIGNIKDEEKIKEKINKAKKEFEDGLTKRMSLESNYCQIISLGYIMIDEENKVIKKGVLFDEQNDISILKNFIALYQGCILIGWNIKKFDIPVIWKRYIFNKMRAPFVNYRDLLSPYYDKGAIDLMHVWNGSGNYGKMSECAKLLDIECKTGMDGSMIYDAYKNNKFAEIKDYNMSDCECCLEIYKRIMA